jgi:long-subunit acyl-CoA synthetase (AMP-forming)
MSNGEKMLPGLLENALLAHPDIRGAVVFGRGQDCVGVLIELKNAKLSYSVDEQLAMRELFWFAVPRRLFCRHGLNNDAGLF